MQAFLEKRPPVWKGGERAAGEDETVVVERAGAVATVRLNRPEQANALTRASRAELARALRDASRDGGVRCIVLAGAGRNFCAGQDLREEGGLDDIAGVVRDGYAPIIRAITEAPKPVLAAVQGAAAARAPRSRSPATCGSSPMTRTS